MAGGDPGNAGDPGGTLQPVTVPAALAGVTELPRRRSPARAALVALRPRQWLKNLLLFAGIVFAAEVGDPVRWLEAVAAFVAYCAASSAAYLVNDLRDVEADRLHPVKRRRPIARGELRPRAVCVLAVGLAFLALALTAALGPLSLACVLAFVALQAAYTLRLKHVVLVDVLVIAALFVIRAAAGAIAVDVRISPWLLVCTALLALFLALGKRRAELVLVGAERTPGRAVLEGYSLALVDQLLAAVAGATIVAYAVYTLTARDSRALVVTVPFVVFGLGRYLQLLHRHEAGEEPENVLLGDLPILVTVALWATACGTILALS
jgi:4-hydroxybenzoate polyprenyltransferase